MTLEARFLPAAVEELENALRWYEARRPGLGAEFLEEVDEALAKIVDSPAAYAVVHRNVRRVLLHRFPYGLFYVVERTFVVVVACFHVRRDPSRWSARG